MSHGSFEKPPQSGPYSPLMVFIGGALLLLASFLVAMVISGSIHLETFLR